jgi:hypothetical protein
VLLESAEVIDMASPDLLPAEELLPILISIVFLMRTRCQRLTVLVLFCLLEEAQSSGLYAFLFQELQDQVAAASAVMGLTAGAFSFVRRPWELSRQKGKWQQVIFEWSQPWGKERWRQAFRMDKTTFDKLVSFLTPYLRRAGMSNFLARRRPVPVDMRVGMALLRLAGGTYYHIMDTVSGWGIAKSTICQACNEVYRVISSKLGPRVIKFPSSPEDMGIAEEDIEHKFGFRGCLGFVDGTHIQLQRKPSRNGLQYVDYKKNYSFSCHVTVDSRGYFTSVLTGYPGCLNDKRLWRISAVQTRFAEGQAGNRYLLADSGYDLKRGLMVPYKESEVQGQEYRKCFNEWQSTARSGVERCIEFVKGRHRIFCKPTEHHYKNVPAMWYAAVCLYNFCLMEVDENDPAWFQGD